MMMMMSLCRDIVVFFVSLSSLGKTKRFDEEDRKKRRKRHAGERASVFFLRVVSVAFSFATKANVWSFVSLSKSLTLLFLSILLLLLLIIIIIITIKTKTRTTKD